MSITKESLNTLTHLAYLDVDEQESSELTEELNSILDYVLQLQGCETAGVTPLFHPLDQHQALRADEVMTGSCLSQLAGLAPEFGDDLYLVPKVIDEENE